MSSETHIAPTEILPAPREKWLDRWCAARWRALVSWIALTGISIALVNFGLLKVALKAVDRFAKGISAFVVVPSDVVGIWNCITIAIFFVWFHPLLLRLNGWRSIAWTCASTFAFTALLFSNGLDDESGGGSAVFGVGLAAALPGVALIGWRSRPWMTLIAGALFVATLWLTVPSGDVLFGEAFGNPIFPAFLAANVPYAAVLLYGTELKARTRRSQFPP